MHTVAIGDIGVLDDMIHIGDEAMFEAFVDEARSRGLGDVIAVSANPAESSERYGLTSIRGIGFASLDGRAAQEDRLDRAVRTAAGEGGLLPADDTVHGVIEAIRDSGGVVITGGGNLASTWPSHIFERLTIAAIAEALDKRVVVSGQTIGPFVTPVDAVLLRRLFSIASLVGVRESRSLALAGQLGVPAERLHHTADDASFLAGEATPPTLPFCVVTLANHVGDADREQVIAAIADLLDEVVAITDLDIVFLAHFGSLAEGQVRGDSVVHKRVIAQMRSRRVLAVVPADAAAAARLARSASLVVTGRYHPAVFAVPAGVPTIGIPVDDYTTVKLTGALRNFGQDGILPVAELLSDGGPALVERLWASRDEVRANGRDRAVEQRAASAQWWDLVAAVLAGP